ncbi:MAG: class I SAM-dependent methyltransferase, partial [Promethearchaeota archaeon]
MKTEALISLYEEFEGDLEIQRMVLTDEMNKNIFQKHFDLLEIISGMNIMDFGCGPGISTRDLARRANPGMVFGIDIKDSAIEAARKISKNQGVHNVEFCKMDASNVEIQDNTFHITFARNLLMSVPRPQKVLKEMVRVTKPGGCIAIVSSDGFMSNLYPLSKDLKKH